MGGICPCCSKTPVVVPAPTPTSSASATPFRSPTPRLLTPAPSYKAPRIDTPFSEHKYLPEASFTNVGVSANNPLRLIQGYKNEPLVSLEEALTPFYSKIDHLADHIREAKSKCYFSPEQGLTRDESAALHIYASQWGEDCLYNKLQAAWKSESPAQMKPWLKYLKLFKNGYDKLPDAKGEIWQGTSFDPALNDQLTAPSLDMYSAMGACSSSRKLVEEYLEDRGDREKIILGFRAIGAKSLGPYASNGTGDTILWPGAKIGLANLEVFDETGSVIFHLTGKTSTYHCDLISHLLNLCLYIQNQNQQKNHW